MAEADGPPKETGWLTKRGAKFKTWRRRWFDFDGIYLKYYKSPNRVGLKGAINLSNAMSVRDASSIENAQYPQDNLFVITVPKRNFFLAADTEDEKNKWIDLIDQGMRFARANAPPRDVNRRGSTNRISQAESDDSDIEEDEAATATKEVVHGRLQLAFSIEEEEQPQKEVKVAKRLNSVSTTTSNTSATSVQAASSTVSPVPARAAGGTPTPGVSSTLAASPIPNDDDANANANTNLGDNGSPGESQNESKINIHLKVVLMGAQGTGKTQLRSILAGLGFLDSCPSTKGIDFVITFADILGRKIKVQIWEGGAGIETGRKSIVKALLKSASIVLLCYDVNDRNSLNHAVDVLAPIVQENLSDQGTQCRVWLLGTKTDESQLGGNSVSADEVKQLIEPTILNFLGEISTKEKPTEALQLVLSTFDDVVRERVALALKQQQQQ